MVSDPTTTTGGDGAGPARDARWARRVLIPIDASAPSTWAVMTGGQLAEEMSAAVILLHVVTPAVVVPSEFGAVPPDEREAARGRGIGLLASASKLLPADVPSDVSLREGEPAAAILRCAREQGADLVVMGTRGMGRIARLMLGSTAEAVIRTSPCPVITVAQEPAISASSSGSSGSGARGG